jgi:hypothetical protein
MFLALVIVHDLDLVRVALAELEADPPRSDQNEGSKVERRSATSISCGGTAHDVMDPNQPLMTIDIEEDPIVPDPLAELGGMVSQWQDVSLRRVEGELVQRPVDATAIIQRKLSQSPPCAVREDQLPGHA